VLEHVGFESDLVFRIGMSGLDLQMSALGRVFPLLTSEDMYNMMVDDRWSEVYDIKSERDTSRISITRSKRMVVCVLCVFIAKGSRWGTESLSIYDYCL
jgi:hypothetical protein